MHIAADQQSEQTANGTEKEKDSLITNGTAENGNGKESPNQGEESDLFPERYYRTFGVQKSNRMSTHNGMPNGMPHFVP